LLFPILNLRKSAQSADRSEICANLRNLRIDIEAASPCLSGVLRLERLRSLEVFGFQRWVSALVVTILLVACASRTHAATPAEYIAAEQPSGTTLEETPSATSSLGIEPSLEPITGRLLPSRVLGRFRERIPKTGIPFIDDAAFTVAPRYYYRYRSNRDGSISEAFAAGGSVGLVTGRLFDRLRFGFAGYTSLPVYGPSDRDGTGLLRKGQKGYTVLGEAYADLKLSRSSLTIGRMRLNLPYLNDNDSRMTPNTFEAIALHSTELESLQVGIGHVQAIKPRTSSIFQSMSEAAGVPDSDRGVSVAGVRWNITDDFHVAAVDLYGWDTFNTFYFESERSFLLRQDLTLNLATQFTDERSVGEAQVGHFTAQLFGLKAEVGVGESLVVSSSFTWSAAGTDIQKPWGGSPSYNSVIISDFDSAGMKAGRLATSYDFAGVGLNGWSAASYLVFGQSPDTGGETEFGLTVDYKVPAGIFDNLWLRWRAAWNSQSGSRTVADYRVILNYSFTF